MPYITSERKLSMVHLSGNGNDAEVAGELNYQLTSLLLRYMDVHGLSYQTINDILGALEGSKLEFYRRVVVPYEDVKIATNGDVYPSQAIIKEEE